MHTIPAVTKQIKQVACKNRKRPFTTTHILIQSLCYYSIFSPFSSSRSTMCPWPWAEAICSAVRPCGVAAFTSAPVKWDSVGGNYKVEIEIWTVGLWVYFSHYWKTLTCEFNHSQAVTADNAWEWQHGETTVQNSAGPGQWVGGRGWGAASSDCNARTFSPQTVQGKCNCNRKFSKLEAMQGSAAAMQNSPDHSPCRRVQRSATQNPSGYRWCREEQLQYKTFQITDRLQGSTTEIWKYSHNRPCRQVQLQKKTQAYKWCREVKLQYETLQITDDAGK